MANPNTNSKAALVGELNGLLADHFALFIKTKNFHWHVKGPRFRDLHLLFDEQALEIRDQIDLIAERVRKLDADTLTSVGSVAQHTKIKDQDSASLGAEDMIAELRDDNVTVVERLKGMKPLAEQAGDNATDGLIDDWTDMTEQRVWFLKSLLA
ncbi:DNA starvation/stationary phase protection protein [Erythrobacter sp. sf7]|uniref:DNA starvation/stationary phase protection protein n=1 Tax=Erythrobacter fulvus TaxID=2987523 RepID=A0ABT5JRA8_9SPHN|nr:DNA starvation/stationary phase protection protein [Erythrobacter fulvus]MDC8755281.1 DNA starvation/stationary phase protection protein [Erythrobacter fulvus]